MTKAHRSSLHVKDGCAIPAPPETQLRTSKRERSHPAAHYIEGIQRGSPSVLASAITLIESSLNSDREVADEVLAGCLAASGNSIRIGVTGIPGAGKSSLIETLGKYLINERHEGVAVLAVDPSSQLSGGSILGDKTRMTFLASSGMAFIRPSPSRGGRGGVAQKTREAILLCEAAGYRNIFVETVGVGQSEAAVRSMVDFLMLITLGGGGDELQGIKRGLMEIADVVVVNKADGDNMKGAERARTDAANALHLLPASPTGWTPRAMCCSAKSGSGIAELWSCILGHDAITKGTGWFDRTRRQQALNAMRGEIELGLLQTFRSNAAIQQRLPELERDVLEGRLTIASAVRQLLALFATR